MEFSVGWWRKDGVPKEVGEWFLKHRANFPGQHAVWVAIYKSGVPVPEASLQEAMSTEIDRHLRSAVALMDERAGYSHIAWIARICRAQYSDSKWWQENPVIMAALEFQDMHDGLR
jgi:hypothetical protein